MKHFFEARWITWSKNVLHIDVTELSHHDQLHEMLVFHWVSNAHVMVDHFERSL